MYSQPAIRCALDRSNSQTNSSIAILKILIVRPAETLGRHGTSVALGLFEIPVILYIGQRILSDQKTHKDAENVPRA